MKKKIAVILFIIVLSLSLAACTRSASKEPADVIPTQTPGEEQLPFPVNTKAAGEDQPTAAPAVSSTPLPDAAATPLATVPVLPPTPLPTLVPTMAALPVTTQTVPATYIVQQGEFPYCLARRFNVDPGTLLSVNGLGSSSRVSPGTTLSIPTGTTWSGAPRELMPHPATYTVRSGDTIYSIACAYGDVFPENIAEANGIQQPYALSVGQLLQIP